MRLGVRIPEEDWRDCVLFSGHAQVKAGRTGLDQAAVLPRGVMKGERDRGITVCARRALYKA